MIAALAVDIELFRKRFEPLRHFSMGRSNAEIGRKVAHCLFDNGTGFEILAYAVWHLLPLGQREPKRVSPVADTLTY